MIYHAMMRQVMPGDNPQAELCSADHVHSGPRFLVGRVYVESESRWRLSGHLCQPEAASRWFWEVQRRESHAVLGR